MKLSFDESATSARKGLGRGASAKSVAVNTQVDKRVVVVRGNEPLKHKLDCKGGNEEAEKVQVVGDATGGGCNTAPPRPMNILCFNCRGLGET